MTQTDKQASHLGVARPPWHATRQPPRGYELRYSGPGIFSSDDYLLAETLGGPWDAEALAASIVRAVNAFYPLVDALKDAREAIASLDVYDLGAVDMPNPTTGEADWQYGIRDELLSKIDAALKLTEASDA